jgi:3-methyl-2-oxobutanoate hydroxymethyltransferase
MSESIAATFKNSFQKQKRGLRFRAALATLFTKPLEAAPAQKRHPNAMKKNTTKTIRHCKGVRRLVCLTAYDTVTAHIADDGGADLLLVGDSAGNTILGFDSSVYVTLDMMLHHTAAVARARTRALLVADVPFAVAHHDFPAVLDACARLIQAGADAVKIEGGTALAPVIARLVEAGIPVCGHIGLQPQQINRLGGYKKFGNAVAEAAAVRDDALAIERAGVFAIVGEMLAPPLAASLSAELLVPLIGIGSGPDCDGQILVIHDLLGFTENPPPFARPRAHLGELAVQTVAAWAADVRDTANSVPAPKTTPPAPPQPPPTPPPTPAPLPPPLPAAVKTPASISAATAVNTNLHPAPKHLIAAANVPVATTTTTATFPAVAFPPANAAAAASTATAKPLTTAPAATAPAPTQPPTAPKPPTAHP